MTKCREILRLKHLGFSERNIARTAGVSRNTVKGNVYSPSQIPLRGACGKSTMPDSRTT